MECDKNLSDYKIFEKNAECPLVSKLTLPTTIKRAQDGAKRQTR